MRCVTERNVVMWSCRLPPFLRSAATEAMTTDSAPLVSRRQLVPFAALSASYFAHIGFFNPYLPLWLKHLGLSLWMIGLLTSMQAVTRVFAPYLWGWLSDRSGERVPLMRWCAGMALLPTRRRLPAPSNVPSPIIQSPTIKFLTPGQEHDQRRQGRSRRRQRRPASQQH